MKKNDHDYLLLLAELISTNSLDIDISKEMLEMLLSYKDKVLKGKMFNVTERSINAINRLKLPSITLELQKLTVDMALALRKFEGKRIRLNVTHPLSAEAVRILMKYNGNLGLDRNTSLSEDAYGSLAHWKGWISNSDSNHGTKKIYHLEKETTCLDHRDIRQCRSKGTTHPLIQKCVELIEQGIMKSEANVLTIWNHRYIEFLKKENVILT